MTGLSPGAMLPLFYGTKEKDLKQFGFAGEMQFAVASDTTSYANKATAPRNLFGLVADAEAEIYTGQGTDREQRVATRKMLQQLAIHMMKCRWPGTTKDDDDNRCIPAGYTYLAQLAAHDLVNNIAPLPRLNDAPGYFARDYRSARLVLDTIYGGGPAATPLPFELGRKSRGQRHRLRLGHILPVEPAPGKPRPLPMMDQSPRDIGRVACPFLSDDHGTPIVGVPDALLADPRNDDHVVISQVTALFHQLHNIVDRKLEDTDEYTGQINGFVMYRRFLDARKIVALAYRSVIINDLLYKLLDRSIYENYKAGRYSPFLDSKDDGGVPVEFSHAVYRIGHVMTQPDYQLNEKLNASMAEIFERSSARLAERLPIARTWLVDWSLFFELGDKRPLNFNFSRAIRPYVGGAGLADNTLFPNEDQADGGIFYRDLIRGADAGVRTVDSIIKHLRREDVERSQLLHDRCYRQQEILNWLTQRCDGTHGFSPADLESLSQNPPLMFFVLFEAALTKNGKCLGILGSVVVAEVFFNAYKKTSGAMEGECDDDFRAKVQKVFPDGVFSDMPKLIDFVTSEGELP